MSKELKSFLVQTVMRGLQRHLTKDSWEVAVITAGVIQVKRLDSPPTYYTIKVAENF